MKYIIVKVNDGDSVREWPIIFPDNLVHSIMAEAMEYYFRREVPAFVPYTRNVEVTSAGAIEIDVLYTVGKSDSLKIGSKKDDNDFISGLQYNHGIRR